MKNKEFSISNLGKEYQRQHPTRAICKLIPVIGMRMFNQLLISENLQGMHIAFPRQSTLQKIVMRSHIRNSLGGLRRGGAEFNKRLKELSELYGVHKCYILYEFDAVRGKKKK